MQAMVLERTCRLGDVKEPLRPVERPDPVPQASQVLLRVSTCGVCHTEIDEIEGRMPPRLPVILGHQVVGRVEALGSGVHEVGPGDRVGVAWIHAACGHCERCLTGQENLCNEFVATGRDVDGGYAEFMLAPAAFVHPIPGSFSDSEAAPLLCAGAIGYRSLRLCHLQDGQRLGLTGFGASAHLVLKMVRTTLPHTEVFVFARDEEERRFARQLGAVWAGDTAETPPERLHAIIDTTPVWRPVVQALEHLEPGGRLVINAIRKEEADQEQLLHLRYPEHLWMEKEIKSVANVTRADVREFLELAQRVPIRPEVSEYALADANRALQDLKRGRIRGAKVLRLR